MDYDALVLEKEITKVFNLQMNNKQKLRESTAKDRIEKLMYLPALLSAFLIWESLSKLNFFLST